jgi:hypothetical protein
MHKQLVYLIITLNARHPNRITSQIVVLYRHKWFDIYVNQQSILLSCYNEVFYKYQNRNCIVVSSETSLSFRYHYINSLNHAFSINNVISKQNMSSLISGAALLDTISYDRFEFDKEHTITMT